MTQNAKKKKKRKKYAQILIAIGVSLVSQMVKNLPAMWETCVQYLGWEDRLVDDMATHSSILA